MMGTCSLEGSSLRDGLTDIEAESSVFWDISGVAKRCRLTGLGVKALCVGRQVALQGQGWASPALYGERCTER